MLTHAVRPQEFLATIAGHLARDGTVKVRGVKRLDRESA